MEKKGNNKENNKGGNILDATLGRGLDKLIGEDKSLFGLGKGLAFTGVVTGVASLSLPILAVPMLVTGGLMACGVGAMGVDIVGDILGKKNEQLNKMKTVFDTLSVKNSKDEKPKFYERKIYDTSVEYHYWLPLGISKEDIEKELETFATVLDYPHSIEIVTNNGRLIVVVKKEDSIPDLAKFEFVKPKSPMELIIGVTHNGEIVRADLTVEPHIGIGGTTQSGKSVCGKSILMNYISGYKPETHKLWLVDLKGGLELSLFRFVPHCERFVRRIDGVDDMVSELVVECDRRFDLLWEKECVNIDEYNDLVPKSKKLDRKLVYIEEFAQLVDASFKSKKGKPGEKKEDSTMDKLIKLTAIARALGIHFVYSTQRPDAETINGRIKANVTTWLGFKTASDIDSKILMNEDILYKIEKKGRGFMRCGAKKVEFQGYYMGETQEVREWIKPFRIVDDEKDLAPKKADIVVAEKIEELQIKMGIASDDDDIELEGTEVK